MSEQLLGARPVFGLHEDAADEVPGLVGDVRGQQRVGGLRGDLEDGRHGLVLGPGRLLSQHLHHRTAEAPGGEPQGWEPEYQYFCIYPGSLESLENIEVMENCFQVDLVSIT